MSKKITVIGGAGFLGTSFCTVLAEQRVDFEILDIKISRTFPDNSKVCDVRNLDDLRRCVTGELIVLLAAVHRDDVRDLNIYHSVNVAGAENVITVCEEKLIRKIVFTSSVAVYGFADPQTGESGSINPFNEYGKTKFLAEERLRRWQENRQNSLIVIRPTVIFGEGNRGNVYNLLSQINSGRFVMISSGKNKKSMAYVKNVADFLYCATKINSSYALYNYVDSPDLDMNELVAFVREVLGKKGPKLRFPFYFGLIVGYVLDFIGLALNKNFSISAQRVRKFCATTSFSSSKGEVDDFSPRFSLKDGLRATLSSEFLNPSLEREVFFTE